MTQTDAVSNRTFYRRTRAALESQHIYPNDLSQVEQRRFAKIVHKKDRKARDEIAVSVADGNLGKARWLQRRYIGSFPARYAAASAKTVVPYDNIARRFPIVYSHAELIGFNARPAAMTIRKKPKASGGTRILAEFQTTDKAQQKLLANSVLPFLGDRPDQYGQRGRDLAIENLRGHAEAAGPDAMFLHGDVRQFFDNVSQEWLRINAPIPKSMVSWMFASGYTITPRVSRRPALRITEEEIERLAQRGLPQGSALSPLIAELVIERVIAESGPLQRFPLVNYSDNFGLVVPAGEAERLEQTLREGFRSFPAGPFDIRFTRRSLSEECRFGGYSFSVNDRGTCDFWVREEHWRERYAYFSDKLQNGPTDGIENTLNRMHSYCRAFSAWSGCQELRRSWEAHAVSVLEYRMLADLIPGYFQRA